MSEKELLEGKEIVGTIGDVGGYYVDVDAKGKIVISASINKDLGHSKISNETSIETDIFRLAEEIAKKTSTTLDDKGIALIKGVLGIRDEEPAVNA